MPDLKSPAMESAPDRQCPGGIHMCQIFSDDDERNDALLGQRNSCGLKP